MPWQELLNNGWLIVGMNHYKLSGKRYLFCAMSKDGRCIKSEGEDDSAVFDDLHEQAGL